MPETFLPLLARLADRHQIVIGAMAVTAVYLLFTELSLQWSLAGIAVAIAVAAGWPVAGGAAGGPASRREDSRHSPDGDDWAGATTLSLLDGLPDAALVLDPRGAVVSGNVAAGAIAPIPKGRQLTAWNRSPELLAAVENAQRTGAQQRCNVRLFAPVERSLDVLVTPAPSKPEAGHGVMLITLRDLTEQEHLARMRADFVANASHELRTPLSSLRGFIETLQGAAKEDEKARARFLVIMQSQAERMSRLIDDLLSLSRIEMREHVVPTTTVDLAAIASDTVGSLKLLAETSGIFLQADLGTEPAHAVGDRDELAQVAHNLIQNAIKYGRRGGTVEVSIRRNEAQVILEVKDDGIGIAAEHLPRLTERFYRVSAKDSKERGGTGLGLAIVKHIVNRHRGELMIASTPGKGSTFGVALPVAP